MEDVLPGPIVFAHAFLYAPGSIYNPGPSISPFPNYGPGSIYNPAASVSPMPTMDRAVSTIQDQSFPHGPTTPGGFYNPGPIVSPGYNQWLALVGADMGMSAPAPRPNQAAVNQYRKRAFRRLVGNEAVECTEIAQTLQDAAGGAGRQFTINPAPGTDGQVRWPTSRGPASGNYHTVYADEHFVYDPRYRNTPIPIAEWEAEVNALNGAGNLCLRR